MLRSKYSLKVIQVSSFIVICVLLSSTVYGRGRVEYKPILPDDIRTLTLKSGLYTLGRRSNAVPQLSCVGGSAAEMYEPPVVQCYNQGSDGIEVQWKCVAENMPDEYDFGVTDVVCEGYASSEDRYVLAGSCGLEYTLELTGKGREERHESTYHDRRAEETHERMRDDSDLYGREDRERERTRAESGGESWGVMRWIGTILILMLLWSCCCGNCFKKREPRSVPHTAPPASAPHFEQNTNCSPPPQTESSGPGFWSGAALGATGGYLFGRNRDTPHTTTTHTTHHVHNDPPSSSWWNRSSGNSTSTSSSRRSGLSSSSRKTGSGTHTSTGYGGTKKR